MKEFSPKPLYNAPITDQFKTIMTLDKRIFILFKHKTILNRTLVREYLSREALIAAWEDPKKWPPDFVKTKMFATENYGTRTEEMKCPE